MRMAHIGWNLAGLSLPLLVAAITVPHLMTMLGHERFGLLALAWGLIGYAGALDLGIGRAATQYVARLKAGKTSEHFVIPAVLATGVRITLFAGGVGALGIIAAGILDIGNFLKVEEVDSIEIKISIFLLALALPMQAVSATYRGVNEAYLNFKEISLLRIILGMSNFGVPFLVTIYSTKIYWLVGSLVLSRAIALYAYRFLAVRCILDLINKDNSKYISKIAKELFRFGGWFTVSSILNPAVATADRLIIASTISAAAVSVYVIPYEMVAQSLIVVGAVTTVAFPYLSQLRVTDVERVKRFFYKILVFSVAAMGCVEMLYIFFGRAIINLWLGEAASAEVYPVMKMLSFGLIPYTVGTVCISLLHAYEKTALTAKLNLMEFPVFLFLIYSLTSSFGVIGAAYAWVLRVTINATLLLIFAVRCR